MIRLARAKPGAGAVRFLVGDMTSLPLPPASVDVVTTGYGLRNVPDLDRAIAEIARVLRPGGRFLSLDFEKPAHPGWRRAYFAYLTVVGRDGRHAAARRPRHLSLHSRVAGALSRAPQRSRRACAPPASPPPR